MPLILSNLLKHQWITQKLSLPQAKKTQVESQVTWFNTNGIHQSATYQKFKSKFLSNWLYWYLKLTSKSSMFDMQLWMIIIEDPWLDVGVSVYELLLLLRRGVQESSPFLICNTFELMCSLHDFKELVWWSRNATKSSFLYSFEWS